MANQQKQSVNSASSRIPVNASESQAAQIVGYRIGDVVKLGEPTTFSQSNGGTSAENTPNSTNSPGTLTDDSPITNINADYSSGNSANIPQDSHQATMSNSAEGQLFQVSRYDDTKRLFWAYKVDSDGKRESGEVPLDPNENYQLVEGQQRG